MLLHWIWFAGLKDISLAHKHRLLEQFSDPEALFRLSEKELAALGIGEKLTAPLADKNLFKANEILRRCAQQNIGAVCFRDTAYPRRLKNIPDAPLVLYYSGSLPDWEALPFIGVVGTRKASAYGVQVAHQLGGQIAACGGVVVSGGASGGDTAAMQGALAAQAPVIGVLGCGVDVVYPRNNRKLFASVREKGCLISEYPPGTQPRPWYFPARNRIISGVSNGVLVVEAPQKSGALITARDALEQGRDVFAVPGNINSLTCEGSNALLREGAVPVFSGWDVLREYENLYPGKLCQNPEVPLYAGEIPETKVAQTTLLPEKSVKIPIDNGKNSAYIELDKNLPALDPEEQAVLACLTRQPQEMADIISKLDMPAGQIVSALTMLSVKGLVYKHPGGTVSLK